MKNERIKSFFSKHKKGITILAVVWISITLLKLMMGVYFPLNREDWGINSYWAVSADMDSGIISCYEGNDSFVVVPKYIAGEKMVRISDYAFDYNVNRVETIIIPEGIKDIDHRAFWGCDNLRTLYLPLSISEISKSSLQFSNNSIRNVNVITLNPKVLSLLSEMKQR